MARAPGRRTAGALAVAAFHVVAAHVPLSPAAADDDGPRLGDTPLLPALGQHHMPGPYPVMPLVELGTTPSAKPYRKDHVDPWDGDLEAVFESTRMVKAGGGYTGAGDGKDGFVDVTHRDADVLIKAVGSYENVGGWDTPSGDPQRFGYERHSEQVVFGLFPVAGQSLKVVALHDRIDDNLASLGQAVSENGVNLVRGDGQDPVKTDRSIGKVVYEAAHPVDGVEALKLEAGLVALDREADNFTHRLGTAAANRNIGQMTMRKWEARASTDFLAFGAYNRVGLSTDYIHHDAERLGGPGLNSLTAVSAYQFPDVGQWSARIDGESAYDFTPDTHLTLGLRYEFVDASADQLHASTTNAGNLSLTSQQLYERYYGAGLDNDSQDHNLSARLGVEQEVLDDRLAVSAAVGRLARSGDTQEKYFAAGSPNNGTAMGTSARMVGNPQIAPEVHHRAELGLRWQGEGWVDYGRRKPEGGSWRVGLSGTVDRVDDFNTRDRARGQSGIAVSDYAVVRRNVDADLASAEADFQWNPTGNLATRLNVAFTWGHNRTDGRALYGIAPLEGNWLLDYHDDLGSHGTWHVGGKLRLASGQGRVDADPTTGSGYDSGPTGGFAVLDLHAGAQIHDRAAIQVGVENVLDKSYAIHDVGAITDAGDPERIVAPGRTFYVRAVADF